MRYSFKDIDNKDLYNNSRVLFIFGKYNYFNKRVSARLKEQCTSGIGDAIDNIGLADEFGLDSDDYSESTSLDFDRFILTVDSPSINGLWYCMTPLETLSKKQIEQLNNYIKEPSKNGRLIIVSNDWVAYRVYLRDKTLNNSFNANYIELSFPMRDIVKKIVQEDFKSRGKQLAQKALDYFMIKMSNAYDKYEEVIDMIVDAHSTSEIISIKDIKAYMKGIEYFVVEDFVRALMKPLASDKTNSKKVLKIMVALEDEIGAKDLIYKTKKIIDESIKFRVLINKGIIPIGIKYFYNDVMKTINSLYGENNEYSKYSEYAFRKKADLASETSLRDWIYMRFMVLNVTTKINADDTEYIRALYELCTRSVLTKSRLNNILHLEDILNIDMQAIDSLKFTERAKESKGSWE